VEAGLDAAIVHASKILPLSKIDEHAREVCLDLVYDRRRDGYDPLQELLGLFEGVSIKSASVEEYLDWPVDRRLEQRIVDGNRTGLESDLEEALEAGFEPLVVINEFLLAGMRTVGELFASGEMQLPFVLSSAETMKGAVAYLEPHMEKNDQGGKGTIVLATVKGDVHDIGKNLVDIIFTNNGYEVVNLGIKVGIGEMITAAEECHADAIGMSGLLVKSTLIMRDNLEELNDRRLAHIPVLLGGAALTRTYVERDLRTVYTGRVFYGRDAFEGLRTMERLMEIKGGAEDATFGREISEKKVPARSGLTVKPRPENAPERSPEVATDNPVFKPPFIGSRVAKGISVDEIAKYLNLTSLFRNQWGFRPDKGSEEKDPEFKERVSAVLREQLAKAKEADLLVPQVVWGHFPANARGDDLVVYEDEGRDNEIMRFTFPRQGKEPWLCIADFFRSEGSGEPDWASFQLVTMGRQVSEEAAKLFGENEYQNYLFLHGLGVEMTEALAEYWHRRIREELGYADEDGPTLTGLFRQQYRGGRYSWGYPACPDLGDNAKVVELLGADRIGVAMSENSQLEPEQTTDAIICPHPQAKYFIA
jgi:5-methyltetrahydrofolate--homocysteine methyltransferase